MGANGHVKMPAAIRRIENENQKLAQQITALKNQTDWQAQNSLGGLVQAAQIQSNLTSFVPLIQNNIYAPLTINWTVLMYMYKTHGIIQTAVDMPVLDALRGGLELQSAELDVDDMKDIHDYLEENNVLGIVGEAMIWARLFGGSGVIINTEQDPMQPFVRKPLAKLEFYPANRWELLVRWRPNMSPLATPWEVYAGKHDEFFHFYQIRMHNSRILTMSGKAAPYILRWQLSGWGMSEVERMVEDFNSYIRTKEVTYELLEEAKIDVYRLKDLNAQLATPKGTQLTKMRIELMNELKNFNKAIVMDMVDEFEQKQITFSGLAEVMKQNMIGIASALRMPLTKLFGLSASGFNSGEDDIENYNAMVESEVRTPLRPVLRQVLSLVCLHLFGYEPDIAFEFKPLRVMSSVEEETVKTSRQKRYTDLYDRQLLDSKEMGEIMEKEKMVPIETDASEGLLDPHPASQQQKENLDGKSAGTRE